MDGCTHVINAVGIIASTDQNTFDYVHVTGTRNLVDEASRAGIQRFIQISAQGAREDGITEYQTSKWKGEEIVRNSGLDHIIFRPSLVFGFNSEFMDILLDLISQPMVVPVLGNGRTKFQPIYVNDLAAIVVQSLTNPKGLNSTFPVGGPRVLTFDNMLQITLESVDLDKGLIHLPKPLGFLGAKIRAMLLGKPDINWGQVKMLSEDNICDMIRTKACFPINLVDMETWLRTELVPHLQAGHGNCQREMVVPTPKRRPVQPVSLH
jgi:NADH dehydrogenase